VLEITADAKLNPVLWVLNVEESNASSAHVVALLVESYTWFWDL